MRHAPEAVGSTDCVVGSVKLLLTGVAGACGGIDGLRRPRGGDCAYMDLLRGEGLLDACLRRTAGSNMDMLLAPVACWYPALSIV